MHIQQHACAFFIINLGKLENKGLFRVDVFRDLLEVLWGIFSFGGLNEEFFSGEDQDESWLDSRRIKFGAVLKVGSVFEFEFETVVFSAWGGFAVFFKGLGRGIIGLVGGSGRGCEGRKGEEEAG
jgi:hypothetical protein